MPPGHSGNLISTRGWDSRGSSSTSLVSGDQPYSKMVGATGFELCGGFRMMHGVVTLPASRVLFPCWILSKPKLLSSR
jgi:hypothetical protein